MAAIEKSSDKSRRERRKEARSAKNKKKFDSWVQHQQSRESKKSSAELNSKPVQKLTPMDNIVKGCTVQPQKVKKFKSKSNDLITVKGVSSEDCSGQLSTIADSKIKSKESKRKKGLGGCSKSGFSQYLEMEMGGRSLSAEDDLRFERKLAKRLKVKNGRLSAANDDIDSLIEGIPSVLDSIAATEGIPESTESGRVQDENSDDERSEDSNSRVGSFEEHNNVVEEVILPNHTKKVKGRKTKFEEYLEADMLGDRNLAEADLTLERKLTKKLKIKEGNLWVDDEINMLFDGIPSVIDSSNDGQSKDLDNQFSAEKLKTCKRLKKKQKTELANDSDIRTSDKVESSFADVVLENFPNEAPTKYLHPHLRSHGGDGSEEYDQLRLQVRGILNKLSDAESITGEVFRCIQSAGHKVYSQMVCEEVVRSCSRDISGFEQHAAVFAASVAGMACLVGIDFGAKLLSCLAKRFEEEYLKEDKISLQNLALLLSNLYVFGVCSSELMYDFLLILSKRLTELDVSTIKTVLQCCGMKLRGDDPSEMKNLISSVQSRANYLKASSEEGQSNLSCNRMRFMLETIYDIKNNRKRSEENTPKYTQVKKWLQKLKVDNILIRGLKWSQLLDPYKKGQWWLSEVIASGIDNLEDVAGAIDKEIPETKKMLQLAASQRMNTDARRAIFCIIMSAEDYIDAFEKLLRLELLGKQDREIMRVLVECCLQEKIFNKYYCLLASKLCSFDKNHRFTLQYCLWDHFKELDSMPLIRSMHLAKFVAEMVGCFSLSLAVLKAVELNDAIHPTPKRIMHFRVLFEAILEFPDKLIWNVFTRITTIPEYESLRNGIEFFITKYVLSSQSSLTKKFKIARKALLNIEGVVM
ncbi:uncharacterized protein [Primulina eburnea]|uniref:uncharacterized protein isoform X1 n=1 Tax=Primulina eburnea TaxID=1245227 RepID=UPI003C6CA0F3